MPLVTHPVRSLWGSQPRCARCVCEWLHRKWDGAQGDGYPCPLVPGSFGRRGYPWSASVGYPLSLLGQDRIGYPSPPLASPPLQGTRTDVRRGCYASCSQAGGLSGFHIWQHYMLAFPQRVSAPMENPGSTTACVSEISLLSHNPSVGYHSYR